MQPRLVCLDIDGTLTDGVLGPALPGAADAVARVRRSLPVRLVTNSTSVGHARLFEHLHALRLADDPAALVTPLVVAGDVLRERGHDHGVLVAGPETRRELAWFHEDPSGPAVLVAGEVHELRLAELQPAFRRLLAGATLYTVQRNRYFRQAGELVTDVGPLVAFLEYAAGASAVVLGKPSPVLFDRIAAGAGLTRADLVMVGDDAEFDACASVAAGMAGVLVRTGKYRPGDEARHAPPPSAVLATIGDLPAWLGL